MHKMAEFPESLFLGEAILSASYLINLSPSITLGFDISTIHREFGPTRRCPTPI